MEFSFVLLGIISTILTQVIKRSKIDARIVVCVVSLFVACLYSVIFSFGGQAFLATFLKQSALTLGMASTIYGFLRDNMNKMV